MNSVLDSAYMHVEGLGGVPLPEVSTGNLFPVPPETMVSIDLDAGHELPSGCTVDINVTPVRGDGANLAKALDKRYTIDLG